MHSHSLDTNIEIKHISSLLPIVLSVLVRFTACDYIFGICLFIYFLLFFLKLCYVLFLIRYQDTIEILSITMHVVLKYILP